MLPLRAIAASAAAVTVLAGGAIALPSTAHARSAAEVVSLGGRATQRITVNLLDDRFMPTSRTVKAGSTITYVWKGKDDHNVTISGPQKFASKTMSTGSYKVHFTKLGTYAVECTIHDYLGMRMTVKVVK